MENPYSVPNRQAPQYQPPQAPQYQPTQYQPPQAPQYQPTQYQPPQMPQYPPQAYQQQIPQQAPQYAPAQYVQPPYPAPQQPYQMPQQPYQAPYRPAAPVVVPRLTTEYLYRVRSADTQTNCWWYYNRVLLWGWIMLGVSFGASLFVILLVAGGAL